MILEMIENECVLNNNMRNMFPFLWKMLSLNNVMTISLWPKELKMALYSVALSFVLSIFIPDKIARKKNRNEKGEKWD